MFRSWTSIFRIDGGAHHGPLGGRSVVVDNRADGSDNDAAPIEHHQSTTSVPPTTTTTTLPEPPDLGIVHSGDGLSIVSFGDPVDDVMAILTRQLGTPSSDEFPYPGESIFPGTYWRVVLWHAPNLQVHFMDWNSFEVLGAPVFGYWGTGMGEPSLASAEGIGPGTPWVDVVAVYSDRAVAAAPNDDVCRFSWVFSIDRATSTSYFFHMRGDLDGDPADPATAIRTIHAGVVMEGC